MRDWIIGSCILILAVLVIRKLFGTRINSRFRYALWAVVLVRLLCPVAFWNSTQLASQVTDIVRAQFSDASGRTNASQIDQASIDQTGEKNSSTDINTTADVNKKRLGTAQTERQASQNQLENVQVVLGKTTSNPIGQSNPLAEDNPQNQEEKRIQNLILHSLQSIAIQFQNLFPTIWLCGSSLAIFWLIGVNFRFHHMLCQKRKSKGHFEKLPVYQVAGLSSPCLFGVIHPAIYLCEEATLDPEALSMILQHETCHYRHKDHIWSVLRSLCLTIWWWNPLVWAAAVVSKRDCEMACDEGTLSRVGWDQKFLYAKTLVDAVADKRKFGMTVASTMVSGKSDTERRLRMMLNKKKTRMASMVLAAGIMVSASALCFGGESMALAKTQGQSTEQTNLPILAATDVYTQQLKTDGVDEFCELSGLIDWEYIAQITPDWMKESGVKLFCDSLNERFYVTWQDQMIVIPQLTIGRFIQTSNVEVLSTALVDLDEDGVYELYLTARARIGNTSEYRNLLGVVKLSDFSFDWLTDESQALTESANPLMLRVNEDNELVWCEATYEEISETPKNSSSKEPSAFSLTPINKNVEELITVSDYTALSSGSAQASSESEFDTLGWLIPVGGPRFSWTLSDLENWYGDKLVILSQNNGVTTVQILDVSIWGCPVITVVTVDDQVGIIDISYEFAYEDRDTVLQKMNSISPSSQILGGSNNQAEGLSYKWEGKQIVNFTAEHQKRYLEICKERGTSLESEEERYAHQVTADMVITSEMCGLSFKIEPEMAILYRELLEQENAKAEQLQKEFETQYNEATSDWLLLWDAGRVTMSDYQSLTLETQNDEPMHLLVQSLIEKAQAYPLGGFAGTSLQQGWSLLARELKQSDSDLLLTLYSDGNNGAGFVIRKDGSGYIQMGVEENGAAKFGFFAFTSCDEGKKLYDAVWEAINKSDTVIAK